jgi:hypothetical protein
LFYILKYSKNDWFVLIYAWIAFKSYQRLILIISIRTVTVTQVPLYITGKSFDDCYDKQSSF